MVSSPYDDALSPIASMSLPIFPEAYVKFVIIGIGSSFIRNTLVPYSEVSSKTMNVIKTLKGDGMKYLYITDQMRDSYGFVIDEMLGSVKIYNTFGSEADDQWLDCKHGATNYIVYFEVFCKVISWRTNDVYMRSKIKQKPSGTRIIIKFNNNNNFGDKS